MQDPSRDLEYKERSDKQPVTFSEFEEQKLNYISALEQRLIDSGLVDIHEVDPTIKVDLKYSGTDNFMKADVYGELSSCYVLPEVALGLKAAQSALKEQHPELSLVIFDGTRPVSVQKVMWDTVKLPFALKTKFVSNPRNGSLHNYGAAVDLSIIDSSGNLLDMGTPFDHISELTSITNEYDFVIVGKLTQVQVDNRVILRNVMKNAGFRPLPSEWWHFNYCSRAEAKKRFKLIR